MAVEAQLALAGRYDLILSKTVGLDSDEKVFGTLSEVWRYQFTDKSAVASAASEEGATHDTSEAAGAGAGAGVGADAGADAGAGAGADAGAGAGGDGVSDEKVIGQLYTRTSSYWESAETAPATVDGMLGGFGHTSDDEIAESRAFLLKTQAERGFDFKYAADLGAGIGRVSKNLLCPLFSKVDLVEQSPRLLGTCRGFVEQENLVETFQDSLQTFEPEKGRYDVIWIQWVLGYLTDVDLIATMTRYRKALKPNGVIFIKENTVNKHAYWVDQDDAYFIRSQEYQELTYAESGLKVVFRGHQQKWPKGMFPVVMYALAPADGAEDDTE